MTVSALFDHQYLLRKYSGHGLRVDLIVFAYLRRLIAACCVKGYDIVWVEKELLPWLPGGIERTLAAARVPFVVDYDDAIYHRYDQHASSVVRTLLGRKIDAIMRRASVVVAGSSYLANRAISARAQRVEIIPSAVDLDRYQVRPDTAVDTGEIVIGWIGSPFSAQYLEVVVSAVGELARTFDVRLVIVGARFDIPNGIKAEFRDWHEDSEVSELQGFDIGVMPLADRPEERGKCGYKLIQYMACGLPVVASPVGANCEIVVHGGNGFLAVDTSEWVRALSVLIADARLRRQFGLLGRKRVESKYCLQITAGQLEALLSNASSPS